MSRCVAVAVLLVLSTPCQAQSGAAPGRSARPLDSFFRVAEMLGQPVAVFARTWPREVPKRTGHTELRLTAADRLVVHFDGDGSAAQPTPQVGTVQLWRELPDTVSLLRVVAETQAEFVSRFGPPAECSDPLGPPSHLYMPQRVSRVWLRGPKGTPIRMSWSVAAGGRFDVQLYAGANAHEPEATLRCDATLP